MEPLEPLSEATVVGKASFLLLKSSWFRMTSMTDLPKQRRFCLVGAYLDPEEVETPRVESQTAAVDVPKEEEEFEGI